MAMDYSVLQIVGYQNSGKTTLIEKIVERLHGSGIRVGVLKHHGHGGMPDLGQNKDSTRYFKSGATVTMVEGEGTIQLVGELHEMGIEKKLALLHQFQIDVVIIEGYKNLSYPKIVMIRCKEDLCLLKNLSQVVAIVYWPETREYILNLELDIPKYSIKSKFLLDLVDKVKSY